jgi:DNA sulfur modification protein DndB
MKNLSSIIIKGIIGKCGNLEVFLGFAPANILYSHSFADILNEDTATGYQRPKNPTHSRSFRQYILQPGTSTIPLTFNLRPDLSRHWSLKKEKTGTALLVLKPGSACLAQVDCQHRLGDMSDTEVPFAFMTFIGLDLRAEMALFTIINSKARGLSSSLTDFHLTRLIDDLAQEAPHLLIAKRLNEDQKSPWYKMVRCGGESTSGLMRRTSFRMLQSTIRKVLKPMQESNITAIETQYQIIFDYWHAICKVFPKEWANHRHSLLTKGVGLYALMELLCDFVKISNEEELDKTWFIQKLQPLVSSIDWSSNGMFADAGGRKGAHEVYQALRKTISK